GRPRGELGYHVHIAASAQIGDFALLPCRFPDITQSVASCLPAPPERSPHSSSIPRFYRKHLLDKLFIEIQLRDFTGQAAERKICRRETVVRFDTQFSG